MVDIKNIQCNCCGEYIPVESEVCPYCGTQCANSVAMNNSDNDNVSEDNNSKSFENNDDADIELLQDSNNNGKPVWLIFAIIFLCLIGIGLFVLYKISPNIELFKNTEISKEKISPAISDTDKDSHGKGIDQAKEKFNDEKYDEAAEIFQQEIDKNNNPIALYYMAEIYNKRNYTKLAIRTYKRADNQKTNFYEPKKRLAEIYWQEDEDDKAIKYAEEAFNIKSNDVELLELLFRMYNYKGNSDKALSMCKNIVKVDSSHYNANYYLANYYYKNDNYRETITYLENMLKSEYNTQLSYTLARCYAHIEYFTKAIEVLDRIIEKDPYEADYASYLKAHIKNLREEYRLEHKPKNSAPKNSTSNSNTNKNSNGKGLEDFVEDALF